MDTNDLFEWYPRLYHMTEDGAWSSIRRRGLLSTASLIDLFEIPEPKRTRLLEERRPESVELTHPVHGRVVLRDQKPLWPSKLQNLLTDMTVPQWIRLLNGHVFFWLHPDRLTGLLNARAYRERPHLVLTLDTRSLVSSRAGLVRLSRINSGSAAYMNGRRGSATFQRIVDYQHPRPRALPEPPKHVAELTVPGGVPDLERHVIRAQRMRRGTVLETIWAA
ncbi:MAG TPA: hypothetical protein VKG45_05620 [Actinomycetes bacterium]|nr:hypothetical protein [Actinomycetes bacterium]